MRGCPLQGMFGKKWLSANSMPEWVLLLHIQQICLKPRMGKRQLALHMKLAVKGHLFVTIKIHTCKCDSSFMKLSAYGYSKTNKKSLQVWVGIKRNWNLFHRML